MASETRLQSQASASARRTASACSISARAGGRRAVARRVTAVDIDPGSAASCAEPRDEGRDESPWSSADSDGAAVRARRFDSILGDALRGPRSPAHAPDSAGGDSRSRSSLLAPPVARTSPPRGTILSSVCHAQPGLVRVGGRRERARRRAAWGGARPRSVAAGTFLITCARHGRAVSRRPRSHATTAPTRDTASSCYRMCPRSPSRATRRSKSRYFVPSRRGGISL